MTALIEVALSWVFKNARGRDAHSFFRSPAFADFPEPTIEINSPECGPGSLAKPAQLRMEHSYEGAGKFPTMEWKEPGELKGKVKEWLFVSEDPDSPFAKPNIHGIYGGINVAKTKIEQSDLEILDDSKNLLKGGFHYGLCRKPVVYLGPRPLINHGPHRYFFEIIALSEPLPKELLETKPQPTREQITEAIQGKVLGWGLWVGQYERKWETWF
ncbi:hypothetical protein VM1G_00145 [Cytospora mali]|uniref:Uncharacterized protein n=1 Tax=Cytospora mali TaxID=578113 RepID=A0A194VM97_CYTMA|nr:hypothetical protein VM1G_00145 [Valsa mali]